MARKVGLNMVSMDESWTLRNGMVIPHRSVLAAMTNKQSHDDGCLSDNEINFLKRRAKGGFGIITTAASHVQESGQGWTGEMGVWGDHHVPGLSRLADEIRRYGSKSFVQLFHGGMRSPSSLTGQQPVSASENFISDSQGTSRPMTLEEVNETIASFANAAKRCEEAGFDGVELHGAHGYLIAQFLGAKTNRRTDEFGGDVVQRMTFLNKIIDAIRAIVSSKFSLLVRLSPVSDDIGITLEDTLIVCESLLSKSIEGLHISCWDVFEEHTTGLTLTKEISQFIDHRIPIISTGSVWTGNDAQFLLEEGADAVGVARVALPFPDWPLSSASTDYAPAKPPFTPQKLIDSDLSPLFVDYMRRWKGFVTDGR
ncbi:NADH:flavin oxidoreductase [Candidatus Poseidoniaceae archaeon]|nr:NADH:flavin oxidoreductase [Candidatus Poseidoniaceae archaeon]|tara:strand:- start:6413 stop:7519 length:1107 start_codon:yes stop_codon:yes gene_type:complete